MYKLETGTYGKLIIKNQNGIFEIYINTELGTLLVYGTVLKIFKYKIRFWKHLGSWIRDYKALAGKEKKEILLRKREQGKIKKMNKQVENNIKQSYGI